jgi:hypothetical protein
MIDDEDQFVAEMAIEALSARDISESAVIDAYIRALDKRDDEFDFEQPATSAAKALAKLGPAAQKAIPALRRLDDEDEISDTLREDIARAIAAIDMSDSGNSDK